MTDVAIRVDLVSDELDEPALAARLAAGDLAALRDARSLEGALCIATAEVADELFSAVQRLCFEAAAALLTDGTVVAYRYFSSADELELAAHGDVVVLTGSDVAELAVPRIELVRALYACGARWLAVLDQLGRTPEADHLRPFAAAAHAALAAAGL